MGYGSVVAARGEITPSMARNSGADNGGGGSGGGGGIPDNMSGSATEDDRNIGMDDDDYYEEEEEDEDVTLSGSGSDSGGLTIGDSGRPPVAPTAAGIVEEKSPGMLSSSTRETSGSRVTFEKDDGDSVDGGGSNSSSGGLTPRRVSVGCRSASLSPKQPPLVQAPPQAGRSVGGGGRGSSGAIYPKVHVPLLGQMSSFDWSAPAESDVDDEDDDEDDGGWGQVVVKPVKVARYDKEQRRWMKTMLSLPELRKIMLTRVEKTPQKVTYRRAATLVRRTKKHE